MRTEDALSILDLNKKSSPADVKNAYRKAAFRTHPDRGGKESEFKSVQEAYSHLIRNGTTPDGLYMGGVPIADVRQDLRDFATSMFSDRLARKQTRYSKKETYEMKERAFQHLVKDSLTSVGAEIYNIHGHAMQQRGIPDLFVGHPLWTGWLELKVGNRAVDPLQRHKINDLIMRAVPAIILRLRSNESEEALEWLTAEYDDGMGADCLHTERLEVRQKKELGEQLLRFLNVATKNLAIQLAIDLGMYSWQGGLRTVVYVPAGKKAMDVLV